MIKAFMDCKDEIPPSSALEETAESIAFALESGEQALSSYSQNDPAGMVRLNEKGLYFYRLSVIPKKQGNGRAKRILKSLEEHASQLEKSALLCKVRMTILKNIQLYRSMGYSIYDEEIVNKPNNRKIKVVSMMKPI